MDIRLDGEPNGIDAAEAIYMNDNLLLPVDDNDFCGSQSS
jgi:hypothetical protein